MSDLIRREQRGTALVLEIDNPRTRNGLTIDAVRTLAEYVRAGDSDTSVRVVVLRGRGDHFCSGADLKAGGELMSGDRETFRRYVRDGFHSVIEALAECATPSLAVIRGACVGFGFDMALACDLRLCADDTKFGQVFSRIALVPDGGSSFYLPRLVGLGRALELAYLAENFDGKRAAELGLVNRSVADVALDDLAADWIERLSGGPPIAMRLAKRNLLLGAAGGNLSDALDREAEAQAECLSSADFARGVRAFFEKNAPTFEGD